MWSAVAFLLILWLIAMLSSLTFGGLVHILLVAAAALLIYQVLQRRRPG